MQITGNTILITGGTSGIGRALAEALHKEGNQVIVAGRRKPLLDELTAANPGIKSAALDVGNIDELPLIAAQLASHYPSLNVLINNAGIMKPEDLNDPSAPFDIVDDIVTTNLLAPVRLTTALLPHLKEQPNAAVITVSSGLAFLPLALTPTYCATKAAILDPVPPLSAPRHQSRSPRTHSALRPDRTHGTAADPGSPRHAPRRLHRRSHRNPPHPARRQRNPCPARPASPLRRGKRPGRLRRILQNPQRLHALSPVCFKASRYYSQQSVSMKTNSSKFDSELSQLPLTTRV